jgi:hypothetical protein
VDSLLSTTNGDSKPTIRNRATAVLLGLPWTLACYIGFVEFVIFSIHILLNHLISLFSNSLTAWNDFSTQILFFLVMIPILQVLLYFVVTIFLNFFSRFLTLISGGLNLNRRIKPARVVQFILYCIITILMLLSIVLVFVIVFSPRLTIVRVTLSYTGMILAIACVTAPLLAFLRIMLSAWSSLFGRGPFLYPRAEWVAPFDMAGLLTDEALIHFLDDKSSPLQGPSLRHERWFVFPKQSFIGVFIVFGIVIAYLVLDVQREKARPELERFRSEQAQDIFDSINEDVCNRHCTNACNSANAACLGQNAVEFCRSNCSSASMTITSIGDGSGTEGIVIRFCFVIVCLPLILTFHPITALFRIADAKQHHVFRWVIGGIVFIVLGIVAIVLGFVIRAFVKTPPPLALAGSYPTNLTRITNSEPAIGCGFRVEKLTPVQLAMLGLASESWRSVGDLWDGHTTGQEHNSRLMIQRYAFPDTRSRLLAFSLDNVTLNAFGLYLAWDSQFAALSFPSTVTTSDLAFVIENSATSWLDKLLQSIIPFYSIIFDIFLNSFQTLVTQSVITVLFGPRRFSYSAWSEARAWTNAIYQALSNPVCMFWASRSSWYPTPLKLVVGEGAYGLLAKALAIEWNISGVAFHAPMFDSSPVSAMTRWHDGTKKQAWETNLTSHVLNVYGGNSFQFQEETEWVTRANWEFPRLKKPWESISAAETLCSTVAACATDNLLDDVCIRTVGEEAYRDYFEIWGRPRID